MHWTGLQRGDFHPSAPSRPVIWPRVTRIVPQVARFAPGKHRSEAPRTVERAPKPEVWRALSCPEERNPRSTQKTQDPTILVSQALWLNSPYD